MEDVILKGRSLGITEYPHYTDKKIVEYENLSKLTQETLDRLKEDLFKAKEVIKLEACSNCGSRYNSNNRKRRDRHESKACHKRKANRQA